MATLQTTVNHFARGHTVLELTPNAPTQRDLVDTYRVRLSVHDQVLYDRIQSVRDWQMRHRYVEDIAKACCRVQQVLGQELPHTDDDDGYFPLSMDMTTDWLTISFRAAPTKKIGDLVVVQVYVEQAKTRVGDTYHRSRGQWGGWQELIGAVICCTPADIIMFGTQLLDEISAVEQARILLGVPPYDNL